MLRDHNLISTVRVSKHPETWPHWEECPNFPKNLGIFFGLALSRILGGSNLLLFASRMLPECGIGPLHTSGGCLQMETQRLWRPLWHHSLRYNSSGHCHFFFWVTSKSWCPPSPIHQNFLFTSIYNHPSTCFRLSCNHHTVAHIHISSALEDQIIMLFSPHNW